MPLRQDVQDAFDTLSLTPDVHVDDATKVYRKLALQHHPDRNHGDPSATQRFQQISHSWGICQRYYEDPDWANRPGGRYYDDDDDMELDGEDLFQFYMFMFTETLFDRYNRSSRKKYRNQRFNHPAGPIYFSFGPPSPESYRPSYSDDSHERQGKNTARQQKEKEEYERRKRDLELEIERDEREAKERAIKEKADVERLVAAQERAFQAAHSGNSEAVARLINEYNLDLTAPRNLKTVRGPKKQDENPQYETLLHAAACRCDENLFTLLIEKGANPSMLNKQSLNPFHLAIKGGNNNLVRYILERRGARIFQDYHPSKATLSGTTPLQLAIESNDSATIELLVKHATTHDVERCWKQMDVSEDIKEILRTKKGFVPPGEGIEAVQSRGVSKKAQRQQELTQEKEARIAEELRRAEINRQKKEERAARRAELEHEKAAREEEERQKTAEEAERQCQEEILLAEAERCALEEERRKKASEEDKAEHERQETARCEEVERRLEEDKLTAKAEEEMRLARAEQRAKELEEARLRAEAEEESRRCTEAEARARQLEGEQLRAEVRAMAEQEKVKERAEWLRVQRERLEMQRIEQDRIRKAREERERHRLEQDEVERQEGETRHFSSSEATTPPDTADVPSRVMPNRKKYGEQRRDLRRDKKGKREEQNIATTDDISQRPEVTPSAPTQFKASGKKAKPTVDVEQMDERQRNRYEQTMKRRAQQSARDKERHRKMVEERTKVQVESPTQSEQSEYVPLTPVSTDAARPESVRSMILEPTLLSLNGTPYMEDIQTCIVPDHLFKGSSYEPPIDSGGASFVGKADPVYHAESPTTHKPHRRFYKHRARPGGQE